MSDKVVRTLYVHVAIGSTSGFPLSLQAIYGVIVFVVVCSEGDSVSSSPQGLVKSFPWYALECSSALIGESGDGENGAGEGEDSGAGGGGENSTAKESKESGAGEGESGVGEEGGSGVDKRGEGENGDGVMGGSGAGERRERAEYNRDGVRVEVEGRWKGMREVSAVLQQ